MNPAQRRGYVVNWVDTVATPWTKVSPEPEAGSALAGDDKGGRNVSAVASYGLMTAIDHLGEVTDAIAAERPMRNWAHYSCMRTTLEVSTRVRWLLEPKARSERRLRCVRFTYQNEHQMMLSIKNLTGIHVSATLQQERQQILAAWPAVEAGLRAEAIALGAKDLKCPPKTGQLLADQWDLNTWEGTGIANLWRTGSAAAHGFPWPDAYRPNPGQLDEAAFDTALQGAYLTLVHAFDLYNTRAKRQLP